MVGVFILVSFKTRPLTVYRRDEEATLPRGLRVPVYSFCSEGALVAVQIQDTQ
jgi:hypothetical protein